MMESYAHWLMRWRWLIVLVTIALVFATASGGRFLQFSTDYRVFFSEENPQLAAFEELQATYTKNDNALIVLAPADGNVFTRDILQVVAETTEKAWQVPFSLRVDSLTNFQYTSAEEDDLVVADLVEEPQSLDASGLESVRKIALSEPQLVRRLISPQGHITAINITVELPGKDQGAEVPMVVAKVREIAADIEANHPDIKVYLTGIVLMNNAFAEASLFDMQNLVPIALGIILLAVLLQLKGVMGTLVTFFVIVFSVLSAMGVAGWMGVPLTGPLMSAPTIILTLAVADCVHLLTNWMQGMRAGKDKKSAMVESLRINISPVFLTSATTAIGFLTLNFSEAPPFHHLGNVSAIGVMFAFLYSVTFLPAMTTLLPTRIKPRPNSDSHAMVVLANWVIEQRKHLLWVIGGVIVVLVALIPKNEVNDIFVHYFDDRLTFRTDTDFVVENLTGIYFIDYSLNSGESGGVSKPEMLQQVEDLVTWLETQPEVVHVNTITDVFKRLNRNMHGDDDEWYKLPDARDMAAQYLLLYEMSLPYGLDLNNQIDINKEATRLSVTMETLSTTEVLAFEQRVYDWMEVNTPEILTYGASPTVMFSHIGVRNVYSMMMGTLVALILISLLLVFAFKSWRYGLVSLIPNLAPAGMAFGVWALIDGNIGLGVSVVTAMTLGIVVDDCIHFLSKYLRARREQGLDAASAVRYAFRTVGVALWVTSVALVGGFLVLATSSFEINGAMGLLVSLVIALALFADFLFLPPLLITFDKWLNEHEHRHVTHVSDSDAGSS